MATYAVGDVQGCLAPLKALLKQVNFSPEADCLWLAGDLVNRGPDSLETLRFVKSLGDAAVVVLGNHDLHLLAASRGHKTLGPKDTLQPILDAPDCANLLNWLQKKPLVHFDEALGYAMVHAGIPPMWTLKKALKHSREVEQILQSPEAEIFFANMYGNTPDIWDKELEGTDRWRVITNYFTRMRFCNASGKLELKTKTGSGSPPGGYAPWFSHLNHSCADSNIIFGHWAALQGHTDSNNFIALDTGCVWGGSLTLMRLEDRAFYYEWLHA